VVEGFELDEHELTLLRQAVRAADLCEDLQAVVEEEGPIVAAYGAVRTHPAVVELRQQRILLARLIVALRVPLGDQETGEAKSTPGRRLQRRGMRGMYGIRGGAA
jgi:hypothetical protein